MEGKTNTTTSRWRFTGIIDGEITMDDAFVSQHMLEEKQDTFEANFQIKSRQAQTAKMCHTLRHTGARHKQWYVEAKPCCMCGDKEDWRHIITCKSLGAELIRADSWVKLRKVMEKWGMSKDTWIAIENGVHHCTMNPKKREHDNMPT
jgi:hypothetical protein